MTNDQKCSARAIAASMQYDKRKEAKMKDAERDSIVLGCGQGVASASKGTTRRAFRQRTKKK